MELKKLDERLAEIQEFTASANILGNDRIMIEAPANWFREWKPDTQYKQGQPIAYKGVKYIVSKDMTSYSTMPPDFSAGTTSTIYKPYQGRHGYNWIAGEYIEVGFTRYYDGILYECIADPKSNTMSPKNASGGTMKYWEVVKFEEV